MQRHTRCRCIAAVRHSEHRHASTYVAPPHAVGAVVNHALAMLRNKPDNGWVSWRRKTADQHSRAACPAECHCVCTCSLQFLKLHACTKGCQWASASPRLTALQVHTSLANGECVRCHGGILSTLTQPPLPARLFQLAFQVGDC